MSELADKIRKAITESGMSLNQLEGKTGVDRGRLSRFMRGERDLTLEAAGKLCEALRLDLNEETSLDAKKPAPKKGKKQ